MVKPFKPTSFNAKNPKTCGVESRRRVEKEGVITVITSTWHETHGPFHDPSVGIRDLSDERQAGRKLREIRLKTPATQW